MKLSKIILLPLLVFALAFPACANTAQEDGDDSAKPQSTAEIVAYVADVAVTADEIQTTIAADLAKLKQQEYELRRAGVEAKIAEMLVEREAGRLGVTTEQLLQTEVMAKAPTPAPQDVRQFFDVNQNRIPQITGQKFEDVAPAIEQNLIRQGQLARRNEYLLSLRDQVDVRVMLDPPRVDVTAPAGEPARGPEGAPITIVEFSDFQCPYCRRAEDVIDQVLAAYPDTVRLVYRDYPLPNHDRAFPAAVAARCAGDQDRYWDYHSNLFRVSGSMDDADLKKRAGDLGLDVPTFSACFDANQHGPVVEAAFDEANRIGVRSTPTFYVNGIAVVGAQPFEAFKTIIDEELGRKGLTAKAAEGGESAGG